MSDIFSTYFWEMHARDHHADLMAEAEKARLIKKALVHPPARRASQTRSVQFKLRSTLTALICCNSQLLN